MFKLNIFKGEFVLQNLQLNRNLLDNIPIPLKMKYGRIGLIKISLPSVIQMLKNFTLEVTITDVFVCLESRPMSEWNANILIDAFHDSKQQQLDEYEEEAGFLYIKKKGDEQEMSSTILNIIQNIKVTIERIYVRIEDSYPFALGLLIPSISLRTADSEYNTEKSTIKNNLRSEIAFKEARIEGFSIFMERDLGEVDIDDLIGVKQNPQMTMQQKENRIYQHLKEIFDASTTQEVSYKGRTNKSDIESNDFMLQKLDIDARLQFTIDKVREQHYAKEHDQKSEPQIKIQIVCGGLFEKNQRGLFQNVKEGALHLKVREDQINALTQFMSVTGVYNQYKTGVLQEFYEKIFDPYSPDIKKYIALYEEYQDLKLKLQNNQEDSVTLEDNIEKIKSLLRALERPYRIDVLYNLRNAINERYYGLRQADDKYKEFAGIDHSNQVVKERKTIGQSIMGMVFGKQNHEEEKKIFSPEETQQQIKKERTGKFVRALLRKFCINRYALRMVEIVLISQNKYDPSKPLVTPKENSTMNIDFKLPQLIVQLFAKKQNSIRFLHPPEILLYLAIQGLSFQIYSESNPAYQVMKAAVKNLFIKDYNTPNKALPYFIQTVISQQNMFQALNNGPPNAMELEMEKNPRTIANFVGDQRIKFHTFGQLYIYLNLEFARHLVDFTKRVLQVMNLNYNNMVNRSPDAIKEIIQSGNYYQKMLEKVVATKEQQIKNNIENYKNGKYTSPQIDMDIFFLSPKLIIHESLLTSQVINPKNVECLVIDLGQIEIKTQLVPKEHKKDYTYEMDKNKLYDLLILKFGKLKIYADYGFTIKSYHDYLDILQKNSPKQIPQDNMQMKGYQQLVPETILNWEHSNLIVQITQEFNLQLDMYTCLTPFHIEFPSQIYNVRFEKFIVCSSRKIQSSLFKIMAIYENSQFAYSLDRLLKSMQESNNEQQKYLIKPEIEITKRKETDPNYDSLASESPNLRAKLNRYDSSDMLSQINDEEEEKKLQFQILLKEYENFEVDVPEAMPPLKMEVKFILERVSIQLQEVKITKHKNNQDSSARNLQPSLRIKKPLATENVSENQYELPSSASPFNRKELIIKEIIDVGLVGLKGKIQYIDGAETLALIFLRDLYIKNSQSLSRYNKIISNPAVPNDIEELNIYQMEHHSNKYNFQNQSNNSMHYKNQFMDLDFLSFKHYDPEIEYQSQDNQLSISYSQFDNPRFETNIKLLLKNLKITFLPPDLKKVIHFHVDLQIDLKEIPKQVKDDMVRLFGVQNDQQEKLTQPLITEEEHKNGDGISHRKPLALQGIDENTIKKRKDVMFSKIVKGVKEIKQDEKDNEERIKKDSLRKQGCKVEKKVQKMDIDLKIDKLEVFVPENLYEPKTMALCIQVSCDLKMNKLDEFKETYQLDKAKTMIESELKYTEQDIEIKLKNLQIFFEQQIHDDLNVDFRNQAAQEILYLLKPYNLDVSLQSHSKLHSKDDSDSKSVIIVKGLQSFDISVGLREINCYLIVAQIYFQFMNDLTVIQQDVDWRAKAKLDLARRKIMKRRRIEERQQQLGKQGGAGVDLLPEELDPEDRHRLERDKERMSLSIDQILENEGLIKKNIGVVRALWQKTIEKAITMTTQRHFVDSSVQLDIKGFRISIVDNSDPKEPPVALIGLNLQQLQLKLCNRQYERMKPQVMERWFHIEDIQKSFSYLRTQFELSGVYYNRNSFSVEPFIESFPILIKLKQQTPQSNSTKLILSEKLFNINLTYGLFCNIQRTMVNIMKVEQDNSQSIRKNETNSQQVNIEANAEMHELNRYRNQQIQDVLQNATHENLHINTQYRIEKLTIKTPKIPSIIYEEDSQLLQNELIEITDIQFINKTGYTIKFGPSLLKLDLSKNSNNSPSEDQKISVLLPAQDSSNTAQNMLCMPLRLFQELIGKLNSADPSREQLQNNDLKIDFSIADFRKITKVCLLKNGVFGYFLHHDDGRKSNFNTYELSSSSCIVRIQRIKQYIQVFFESSLVFFNDTQYDINLLVTKKLKSVQNIDETNEVKLMPGKTLNCPLTWFFNQSSIKHRQSEGAHIITPIFDSLSEVFNSKIVKPYKDYSKIINLNINLVNTFVSVDIFKLQTKTPSCGQFLVIFNPVLKIANFLFTELLMRKAQLSSNQASSKAYDIVESNSTHNFYSCNPHDYNLNAIDILYKEDDNIVYQSQNIQLDANGKNLEKNIVLGFEQGMFVEMILEDQKDQDIQRNIYITIEKQIDSHILKNTEYGDFSLRKKEYWKTKSLTFIIYFPYIALNKTPLDIVLYGSYLQRTIKEMQSNFIRPISPKMQIQVDGYEVSQPFDITTFGVSGEITLLKKKSIMQGSEQCQQLMDPSLNYKTQHVLQIGTYFTQCQNPYGRTKILSFLPRYILKNKHEVPLIIKERSGFDQIVLEPGQERYFNLGLKYGEDQIMIRTPDQKIERKKISVPREPIDSEIQYDINQIPSSKGPLQSHKPTLTDGAFLPGANPQFLESRRAISMNNVDQNNIMTNEFQTVPLEALSHINAKHNWSYYFSLSKVDDFQITIPNPNPIQENNLSSQSQGWQIDEKKLFVRVNISPGPDNEATLFVSFTKPYFPEYIFYNQLDTRIKVMHKSTAIQQQKINDIYDILPNSRQAIVLNPNDKDEDFLQIYILDFSGDPISPIPFEYEIDSMKRHFGSAQKNNQFTIITKLSGSLRFIHLMSQKQWKLEKLKKRKDFERIVRSMNNDNLPDVETDDDENENLELENQEELMEDALQINDIDDQLEVIQKRNSNTRLETFDWQNLPENFENADTNITLSSNLENQKWRNFQDDIKGLHGTFQERQQKLKKISAVINQGFGGHVPGQDLTSSLVLIKLQGLSISVSNYDPREIMLLSLYKLELIKFDNNNIMEDVAKMHSKIDFRIQNFQIDNQTPRSFPVILGPRKPFPFRENQFKQPSIIRNEECKEEQEAEKKLKAQPDFLQFFLDMTETKEGKISSLRIKKMNFALQELNINFHSYVVNYIMYFINSLIDLVSDELTTAFNKSDMMFNLERMNKIMSLEDDYLHSLIGEGSLLLLGVQSKPSIAFNQLDLERRQQHQRSVRRLLNALKDKPTYHGMISQFGIDHSENNIDQTPYGKDDDLANREQAIIENRDNKSLINIDHIEFYEKQDIKRKEEVCPILASDQIKFEISEEFNQSKILVQEISIKALRLYLTFRVKSLETALGATGFLQDFINFFSGFANISDASIYFTQIDIRNSYRTQQSIINLLSKHYISQGISQVYKILGATDIVGNPVSLISNLGRGVEELYSEPFQGVLSGSMSNAAQGLKRGVVGFTKKTAFGVSNSVSKLSGTWYVGLRGFSGRQVSESNLDNPHNITSGLGNGAKSFGKEIAQGVTGIYKVPRKTFRESGVGCGQIIKGTSKGFFGFVMSPVTGLLKMIYSASSGIKNQAGDTRPQTRFRFPRYFNDTDVMIDYDPILSHAQTAIQSAQNGQYQNETIIFAYDFSDFTEMNYERFKDRIFICTVKRIICIQALTKVKINVRLNEITHVIPGDLDCIIIRTNDEKEHRINTNKIFSNQSFIETLMKVINQKIKAKRQPQIPQNVNLLIPPLPVVQNNSLTGVNVSNRGFSPIATQQVIKNHGSTYPNTGSAADLNELMPQGKILRKTPQRLA